MAHPRGAFAGSVTVDPDHLLPDEQRANNVWKAAPSP
jgi:hypothetical protein